MTDFGSGCNALGDVAARSRSSGGVKGHGGLDTAFRARTFSQHLATPRIGLGPDRYDVLAYLLTILTVIGPCLHQLATLFDDVTSLIGPLERVALDVR